IVGASSIDSPVDAPPPPLELDAPSLPLGSVMVPLLTAPVTVEIGDVSPPLVPLVVVSPPAYGRQLSGSKQPAVAVTAASVRWTSRRGRTISATLANSRRPFQRPGARWTAISRSSAPTAAAWSRSQRDQSRWPHLSR